jgi:phage protein D
MPVGYTPIYKIMKDDVDITDRFNDRVTEIQVVMTSGGGDSDRFSITLDNRDFKLATPENGGKLAIYLGYKEVGYADQGIYEINTHEFLGPPHSLKITGTSVGFMSGLKAPAFQAHDGKTLGEIVEGIAKIGGAKARVSPEFAKEKVPFFNQAMSPLHMLHELERRYGALAKFQDGYLIFKKRGDGETFSGISQPLLILEPQMFGQYSVRFSERTAYAKVKVRYKDPKTKEIKVIEHGNPNYKREDNMTYRFPKQMNSLAEAQQQARAVVDMLRRQECVGNVSLAKGDPWIRDQMPVLIRNMFPAIDGSYIADTVTHTFVKDAGIQTTMSIQYPNSDSPFAPADPAALLGLNELQIDDFNQNENRADEAATPPRPELV